MDIQWTHMLGIGPVLTALAGALLGIVWGAIPGLSVSMAMALLAALSFNLPTEAAIVFLVSAWTAAEFGGAIPAILLNIPGTPSAVPTGMAGHPLQQRGQGGAAVTAALVFSAIGSWFGLAALALLAPLMIRLSLSFTSWEMFLLVLFGLTVCGNLVARSEPVKGWAMGLLGLLLGMIGKDFIHGVDRYTFGIAALNAGVHYLPVLIGVFGLVAAFNALDVDRPATDVARVSRWLPRAGELRRYWVAAARSSLVGAVVGAIPGAGANIASYVAYNLGERASGRRYAEGDIEGVVCSEAANNANIGGGLLPAVTLGIPGNSSSALVIAALSMHGVMLGPTISQDQPGFLGFLYAALIAANLALLVTAALFVRPGLRVMTLPAGLVMPMVIVFCLVGTFAVNYSTFDVGIMFVAALVGWFLDRQGYPFAPLVLGLILAPLADENLRRSLLVYDDRYLEMLSRPLGLLLAFAVCWSLWHGIRESVMRNATDGRVGGKTGG